MEVKEGFKLASKKKRMELRVDADLYEEFRHFAETQQTSINQAMMDAMKWYMNYVYHDYDLPTAEVERLNQLIVSQEGLSESVRSMQRTMINGFRAILGVMHGSSYLESDETHDNRGEID